MNVIGVNTNKRAMTDNQTAVENSASNDTDDSTLQLLIEYIAFGKESFLEAEFEWKLFFVLLSWLITNIILIRLAWIVYGRQLSDGFMRGT